MPEAAASGLRRTTLGVAGMCLLALGVLVWGHAPDESRLGVERLALTPQECNTECQSKQTDCILACEGRVECEKACVKAGRQCVVRCGRRDADAGAP